MLNFNDSERKSSFTPIMPKKKMIWVLMSSSKWGVLFFPLNLLDMIDLSLRIILALG